MAKLKISDYSSTSAGANLNTDINSIDIDEGCAPSGINNAIRTLMAQLKDFQTGVSGDSLTLGGALSGTSATFSGNVTASAISGASLTLSGNITASAISGASMTLSGDLTVDTNTLYVDSTNNRVGIGTASPACKTDVSGTIRSTTVGAPSSGAGLELSYGGVANTADILAYDRTGASFKNIEMRCSNLIFNTGGGGERMRIDSSGNVGIGTTSPGSILDVRTSNPTRGIVASFVNTATSSQTGTQLRLTQSGIEDWVIGQPAATSAFAIWSGRSAGADGTERMRIDSNGNVGIGCTPSTWTLNPALEVEVGSGIWSSGAGSFSMFGGAYYNSGWKRANATTKAALIDIDNAGVISTLTLTTTGAAGSAITWTSGPYVANGGTSWTTPSDERLKNITSEIEDGLNKVCSLRAVNFTWKQDNSNKNHVGLIAQDVNQILPEAVNTGYKLDGDETEYLGVQYTDTIPLLVKAIQEQQDIIKALETRIQALENQ